MGLFFERNLYMGLWVLTADSFGFFVTENNPQHS
jgi:hypothetical protein